MAIFCRELVNLATPFSHFFLSEIILSSRHSKSVDPDFRQGQSDKNNDKLDCCLEIQ